MASGIGRLVLKGADGHRCFTELAWGADWDLAEVRHTDSPFVEVWEVEGRDSKIHYVRDDVIGTEYVTFHGADVRPEVQKVLDACPLWTSDEAIESLRSADNRDDELRAIYAAALSASGGEDRGLIDSFRSVALESNDSGVRQAIIHAVGYLPWGELVRLVSEMRDGDPDSHVRHNAQVMLDGLQEESSDPQ